jgi:hypothetical protein
VFWDRVRTSAVRPVKPYVAHAPQYSRGIELYQADDAAQYRVRRDWYAQPGNSIFVPPNEPTKHE